MSGIFYAHLMMLIYPTVVLALAGDLGRDYGDLGRDYGDLLALAIWGFVAFGAGSLPSGWLGDRWSRSSMMTVYFVGIGVSAILVGLAQSPGQIAAALALIGLFGSIYHPVGIAMLTANTTRVGRDLGINGVFGNFGVAFAATIAAVLTEAISWRAAFIVPGGFAIVTGLVYAYFVRREATLAVGKAAKKAAAAASPDLNKVDLYRLLGAIVVAALAGGVIFNVTTIGLPKIFDERLPGLAVVIERRRSLGHPHSRRRRFLANRGRLYDRPVPLQAGLSRRSRG